uniref:Lipoprotein n=1 Tax=uncultured myxobacterium HF0200_19H16 TaxID=723559 RepID=E7C3V2_9BACT|nr:hypothetical protein [uncultured myxobacterium HF0200_19H16]
MNPSLYKTLILIPILGLIGACDGPTVQPTKDPIAPTGVMTGTIFYNGPAPLCENEKPIGRIVLTLFEYDNPPAPFGSATSAISLVTLSGDALFSSDDCSTAAGRIQRSTEFTWPTIPLGSGSDVHYQMRAFYDNDGDFNPLFGSRKAATSGDVGGGAYAALELDQPNFDLTQLAYEQISFGAVEANPKGQLVPNITVLLAAPVLTERPIFQLATNSSTRALDSTASFPLIPDPIQQEEAHYALAGLELSIVQDSDSAFLGSLEKAGIELDLNDALYAWYARGIDIRDGGDGVTDLHPILESQSVAWTTPLVILKRLKTPAEISAGLPDIYFIGSPRPTQLAVGKKVFWPSIQILVPPVALIQLDPSDPNTRIPIFAAGNLKSTYENPTFSDCQELPTGQYSVNVFHGFAGTNIDADPAGTSDTGKDMTSANPVFTGQSWSIPNELGPSNSLYGETQAISQLSEGNQISNQGSLGTFVVSDADTSNNDVRAGCEMGVVVDPTTGAPSVDAITYASIPASLCSAVKPFCSLPLCAATELAANETFYGTPQSIRIATELSSAGNLTCTPFLMPKTCCQ